MSTEITLGNLIGSMLVLVGFALTSLWNGRTMRRQNEEDTRRLIEEKLNPVKDIVANNGERLTRVETKAADFMPRSEIMGHVDGLHRQITQSGESAMALFQRTSDEVAGLRVDQATMRQQTSSLAQGVERIEEMLKNLTDLMLRGKQS